eukprot:m.1768 g.1768  ORF g.1768 m.1768 type:complete len:214 (+) comp7808_c0_seq2:634-1275(+)
MTGGPSPRFKRAKRSFQPSSTSLVITQMYGISVLCKFTSRIQSYARYTFTFPYAPMTEVPDISFELLHGEIVRALKRFNEEEIGNSVEQKLDRMGFRVGQCWIERLTKDRVRFKDELEVVKYICKEFWMSLFNKQIDNLRTNHQGVYVLQDHKFHFFPQMSVTSQYSEEAPAFLAYPCGMMRGALVALGINSTVACEITSMPSCKFTITTLPA